MTQRTRILLWLSLFVVGLIGSDFGNSRSVQMQKLWVFLGLGWLTDAMKAKFLLFGAGLVLWATSHTYNVLASIFRDGAVHHAISSKRLGYFSGAGYHVIDIAQQLGRSEGSVIRSLNRLQETGKAVQTSDGWYST